MKVFLSWSGKTSHDVAAAFHHWLPRVLQAVKPFISSGDIDKGNRWTDVLASELGETAYGIICLTKDNFNEPWVNFEAGSISTAIRASYVSPFLFNIEPDRIQGPLRQFEFTVNNQEDILNLVKSINRRLNEDERLSDDLLKEEFDKWWPELRRHLKEIPTVGQRNQTGLDWLYTTDELVSHHSDGDCQTVWYITPRLYRNALISPIKGAIEKNLDRKASYKFIIPSADRDGKETLKLIAEDRGKASMSVMIAVNDQTDSGEFRKLAVTDYLVINADSDDVQVFLELPVKQRGYWVKVDAGAAMGFVMRFRPLADQALVLPPANSSATSLNSH
jgi:TIR domain